VKNLTATACVVSFLWCVPLSAQEQPPPSKWGCCAPLVVPDDPDETVTFSRPDVPFDIDGDGVKEMVAFPKDGAWLVIDLNRNGVVDDGRELAGQATGGQRFATGFEALHAYAFDAENLRAATSGLLLWHDANFDGVSQTHELKPASTLVKGVSVGYTSGSGDRDQFGTWFWMEGFGLYDFDDKHWPIYVVFPAVRQMDDSATPAVR
jgi:hypothetical protein